jgi:2'-5' RNA ligase
MKNIPKYIPTFEEFVQNYGAFLNEKDGPFEYGCSMVFFEFPEIKSIHQEIEESDLSGSGLEEESHVTLLYGLHADEIEDNKVLDISASEPIESIKLHNVSAFENEEFDVLKFDVDSPILHKLNSKLAELPHTNNFPKYHPHCTIAYLKPGTAKKYIDAFEGRSYEVFPTKIIYSKPGGEKISKSLKSE